MKGYDTSELHGRQLSGEVGHAVLGSSARSTRRRRRALLVPLAVLALGILLGLWGPVPGLGMVLTIGGLLGLVMSMGIVLLDGLS